MSRIFESIFRGGKSSVKFPKVEPAQNFRCGIQGLQERAVIFSIFVAAFCVFWGFSFAIILRVFSVVYYTKVDYSMIDSMAITCSGCKIQVTNNANWAGLFSPSNLLMYLPLSGAVLPKTPFSNGVPTGNDGLPSFCSKATRSCSLILGNTEGQLSGARAAAMQRSASLTSSCASIVSTLVTIAQELTGAGSPTIKSK